MNIAQYIDSKDELRNLHFPTVSQTIICLIGDGILSMDDFQGAEHKTVIMHSTGRKDA